MAISIAWNGAIGLLVRICGSCGKKVLQGQQCDCQKQRFKAYTQERRSRESNDFYSSLQWRRIAEAARARAGYADEYILHYEHKLVPARLVHHIVPFEDCREGRLDMDNLICVSVRTHRLIHDAYDKGGQSKAEMQAKLRAIRSKQMKGL